MYFKYFLQYTQTIEVVTKTMMRAIVLGVTTPTTKRTLEIVPTAAVEVVVTGSAGVVDSAAVGLLTICTIEFDVVLGTGVGISAELETMVTKGNMDAVSEGKRLQ